MNANQVTPIIQDYLKAIYRLSEKGQRATTSQIARALSVKPASVTSMMKRLGRLKLVAYRSHHGARLSASGLKIALEVIRHHRLLELYLQEALGYSWEDVHAEAERLEHHISEDFEERIFRALGYPTVDPHGDPIPSKSGEIRNPRCTPLAMAATGGELVVARVSDRDPKLLRYLAEIGLTPQTRLEILKREPFDGPLTLRIGKKRCIIGQNVARGVFVAHPDGEP